MNLGPTQILTPEELDKITPWFENAERFVIIEKYEKSCLSLTRDYAWFESRERLILEFIFKDKNGKPHRNNGNPCIILDDAVKWCKNGNLHRNNNKPAVIRNIEKLRMSELLITPTEEYWKNGELHRDYDLPAIKYQNAETHSCWFINGKLHRDNNKPSLINGNFLYYHNNGKLYKSEINYNNKYINWIMKNPYKIVGILLTIFLLLFL